MNEHTRRLQEVLQSRAAWTTEELMKEFESLDPSSLELKSNLFNVIIQHLPVMIFMKEARELRFSLWNKGAEAITGIRAETVIGKNDFDFFPAEQAAYFLEKDRQVLQTKSLLETEEPLLTPRGLRHLRTRKVAVLGDDGEPKFLLGISEDITDVHTGEAERKRLSWFYQTIVENLPLMLFVKDAKELRWQLWNKAGAELVGVPAHELIGKTDHDFFPEDQADWFRARDREALNSNEVSVVEEPIDTASGRKFLQTRKIPMRDEYGVVQHLLGLSVDITERKLAEDRLKGSKLELESALRQLVSLEGLALTGHLAVEAAKDLSNYLDGMASGEDNGKDRLHTLLEAIERSDRPTQPQVDSLWLNSTFGSLASETGVAFVPIEPDVRVLLDRAIATRAFRAISAFFSDDSFDVRVETRSGLIEIICRGRSLLLSPRERSEIFNPLKQLDRTRIPLLLSARETAHMNAALRLEDDHGRTAVVLSLCPSP